MSKQMQAHRGAEVSCVALGAFFSYLEHLGRDPAPLGAGLLYPEELLHNQHARIDFDTFREICQRFHRMFPDDPEVCYRAGLKVFELQSYGFQIIIATLLGNSPKLFYGISPRMIRQQFSMIRAVNTATGKRSCRFQYFFDPGYEVFPEFVDVVRGLMTGMAIPGSGKPATVKHELTPDGFVLHISWQRSKPFFSRLYDSTVGQVQAFRAAVQELERGHTLLEGKLSEARELSRRLEALLSIGQSVERGLDSQAIVDRFSAELQRWMGICVVFVELGKGRQVGDPRWAALLPPATEQLSPDPGDQPFISLDLPQPPEGSPEEVWLFPLKGQDAILGRVLLGASAAALASADISLLRDALIRLRHALQNVIHYDELEEHRRSLERKVAERTTELRSHARRLEASNEKLQQIDQAKRRFFTHMTHELKNPITLLTSSVEALERRLDQEASLEPPARDVLRGMLHIGQQNIKRVAMAADDLMDLALLEEAHLEPRLVPVDLVELGRAVIQEISLWSESLSVTTALDAPSPVPRLPGDLRLLGKLLLNLLGNAIKFSPPDTAVTLQVLGDGTDVCVRILDRGPGVPPDQRERIFRPFEQTADGQMIRAERGIGIGLSLAREIALIHRGDLSVEDREGGGSVFLLRIPVQSSGLPGGEAPFVGAPLDLDAARSPGPGLKEIVQAQYGSSSHHSLPELLPAMPAPNPGGIPLSTTRTWPDQRKRQVLLIDDEVDILRFVGGMLEHDFEVSVAPSAEAALELTEHFSPDAVVSDILMPGISGMQLCQILRQRPATRHTPVLLITALGELQDKLRGFEYGADDYITKPFQYAELAARIRTQIRLRELTANTVAFSNIAAIGTMAAGIAHEMKNPLNVLLNSLAPLQEELTARGAGSPQIDTIMGLITESSQRLRDATMSFSNMVSYTTTPVPLDVEQLVGDLIRTRNTRTEGRVVPTLSCDLKEYLMLPKGRFSLVVGNLLDNAIDAVLSSEDGSMIKVSIEEICGEVMVRLEDDGVGMDPQLLERSVSMFTTTKEPGRGTGLGLSIVCQIMLAENGRFKLDSTPGKGTTVTVWFPLAEDLPREPEQRPATKE